jgi:DNA-binding response OmpR family regulator
MADVDTFHGRRILIVEDDMLIAIMLEDMLLDLGCVVIGPINTLQGALALAAEEAHIDAAMLDIDLGGVPVFPVADVLRARGVPLIYSSGYGSAQIPAEDRGAAVLHKPFRARNLEAALHATLPPLV